MISKIKIPMNEVKSVAYKKKDGTTKDVGTLKFNNTIIWKKNIDKFKFVLYKQTEQLETTETMNDFAVYNDRIVVVGTNRSIYNSSDFSTWKQQSSKVTGKTLNCAYAGITNSSGGSFVVGGKNTVMKSYDLTSSNWDICSNIGTCNISFIDRFSKTGYCILSSSNKWVNLAFSSGINSPNNLANSGYDLIGIQDYYILLNDEFVYFSNTAYPKYSSLKKINELTGARKIIKSLSSTYYVLCENNIIYKSTDEFKTYSTIKLNINDDVISGYNLSNNILVLVCKNGIYATDDLISFTKLSLPFEEEYYNDVKYSNGYLTFSNGNNTRFYKGNVVKN